MTVRIPTEPNVGLYGHRSIEEALQLMGRPSPTPSASKRTLLAPRTHVNTTAGAPVTNREPQAIWTWAGKTTGAVVGRPGGVRRRDRA